MKRSNGGDIRRANQAGFPRNTTGLGGAILAALVVLFSSIAFAYSDDSLGSESEKGALGPPSPRPEGSELEGMRTATSQTFLRPDGGREARIYEEPVNYRNSQGEWTPIKEGFKVSGNAVEDRGHAFDLELPQNLGAAPLRMELGGHSIAFESVGLESKPVEVEGGAATYESKQAGTTFEYTTLPTGVKETIELADPAQPTMFNYDLKLSDGLRPSLGEDGSVQFKDGDNLVASVPPPTLEDSSPSSGVSQAARFDLHLNDEGTWRLTLVVDRHWLDDPERVWPVQVDPSLVQINGYTCTFELWKPANNTPSYCYSGPEANMTASVGYHRLTSGAEFFARSTMWFNLSAIPVHSFIRAAAVGLYSESNSGKMPAEVQLRELTRESGLPNWFEWAPGLKWTTPGGDYSSAGSGVKSTAAPAVGWWLFEGLGPIVRKWFTGEFPNYGLLAKVSDESPCTGECWRQMSWASWGQPEAWKRPYLAVEYSLQAPSTSKLVSPTEGTRTARRLKLKSKWASAGVTGVTYQYREGKSGPFKIVPPELVIRATGQAVSSWPVAVSGLESDPLFFDAAHATSTLRKKGGIVQVRAVFDGPVEVEGYSEPVETTVNRFTGGPKDATAPVGPGSVDLLTGNLSVTRTDAQIPGFASALEFSRTHNSRGLALKGTPEEVEENKSVLGAGWKPGVPVEEAGGSDWRNLSLVNESVETDEDVVVNFEYAILTTVEGAELAVEKLANGTYAMPPEAAGSSLTAKEGRFILADPGGNLTTFENPGGGDEYVPTAISQPGGTGNATRIEYKLKEGRKRINMVVGPTPAGIGCISEAEATTNVGCHAIIFTYVAASTWGAPASYGDRLQKITSYAPGNSSPQVVANYKYDSGGRLIEEWDSRLSSPLVEKYTYTTGGQLATITPPGQEPWKMEYGVFDEEEANGRLMAVKRASLLSSPSEAQTTIAYGVPVTGAGSPYDLGGSQLAQWAQLDTAVDATAVFPPNQVPTSNPPASYSAATVYYMDTEGQNVNTATPKGSGTSAPSISTTEVDEFGNVVRELTAANRLRALAEPESKRAERAKELDTRRLYSSDGTQMEEEWGPMHQVRLESGTLAQARFHKVVQYDKNWPGTGVKPHLPTRETSGALVGAEVLDERVSETEYNWNLRKPKYTLVDPGSGHLNIKTVTAYDETTGLPIERRQPKDAEAAGAGTTKAIYYKATGSGECENAPKYANLPCKILPAAQASGSGRPELLVKKITAYNALGQPTELIESPGGGAADIRKTLITYDGIGRTLSVKQEGGGAEVPKSEILYSPATGWPVTQQFKCEASDCTGFDNQALMTSYDALGRVTSYADADGNVTSTTYDLLGRPVTTKDNKGSQTRTYDSITGLLTELEDSAAGKFTASYNADGEIVEQGYPNGLVATTTYDEAGAAIHRSYVKTTMCSVDCTWLDFDSEESIYGQILAQTSTLSSQEYSYDKAGRLKRTLDTPQGGSCTTRSYSFDNDSNRTALVTRAPGLGGACDVSSAGTTKSYSYDAADRLLGAGISYDSFGRITSLPNEYAGGGGALTTSYFSNEMVEKQTQNGVTNTFQLDAQGRPRTRIQTGGAAGTEFLHYADNSDGPSWTTRIFSWSRNIAGIGGELAAIQDSSSGVALQLTNFHGDVVATASLSQSATKPTATFEFDEFGNPKQAGSTRFGWLGGRQRRTELASGVIQMGVRSYVPALGRFLTPDPILGGSANAYDYANQDPVNEFDLEGTCATKKKCAAASRAAKAKVRKAVTHIRARMQKSRENRATAGASTTHVGSVPIRLPWEDEAEVVLGKVEGAVGAILHMKCGETAEHLAYAGGTAFGAGTALQAGGPVAEAVGGMFIKLGTQAGFYAGIFYGASKLGVC